MHILLLRVGTILSGTTPGVRTAGHHMARLIAALALVALLFPIPVIEAAERTTIVVVGAESPWPGKIFVNHDEWALSDLGFSLAPDDARSFALNVAAWFTGGRPGNFLVYSNSHGLRASALAAAMRAAGHSWTVATLDVPLTLDRLRQHDAVYVGNYLRDDAMIATLIDYVRSGGRVYLTGGAFLDSSLWNPFLHPFGLGFVARDNDLHATLVPIVSESPLLQGVQRLYTSIGRDVEVLDPASPDARIVYTHAGHALFATYETQTSAVLVDLQAEICPNRLHAGSREALRVAVFGTPGFDVRTIDPASVRLLGIPALQTYISDVGAPEGAAIGKTNVGTCPNHAPDRVPDLILTFAADSLTRAIEARLARAVRHGETVAVTLTGFLQHAFGRKPIVGEDLVVIHAPGKGKTR